jgi:FkbM family methyltransferase
LFRVQRALHSLSARRQKVVYLDVGSAGGISSYYRRASRKGLATLLLLDMQDDWRRDIDKNEYGRCDVRHIKVALGAREESRPFYQTVSPGCSSCLPPNESVLATFPVRDWFRVVARSEILVRPYEAIHAELGTPQPDIVKVDVQGMELETLIGFGPLLDQVTCVELEVNFEQLYVGQPLIFEAYEFMRKRGFALRDLKPQGPFEGQAIEYNSYWSRARLTETQGRIVALWEAIHDVWPGQHYNTINELARRHARFNSAK